MKAQALTEVVETLPERAAAIDVVQKRIAVTIDELAHGEALFIFSSARY